MSLVEKGMAAFQGRTAVLFERVPLAFRVVRYGLSAANELEPSPSRLFESEPPRLPPAARGVDSLK